MMPDSGLYTDAILLTVYVSMALFFSFLCSVAEAVLLSITPSYIEEQRGKKPDFANLLKQLKQDKVDQSLAAILTLNTIAHTVGAILAGAKAAVVFGNAWFGLFSALMTLAILFFSEIVPKTFGAIYWARLTRPTAIFIKGLIVTLYPIVWLSEKFTKYISHGNEVHIFSRAEFIAMAKIGRQTGHLSDKETQFITNVFRFSQTQVREVMVPRTRIVALDIDEDSGRLLSRVRDSRHSRFPVYQGDIDNIQGFVLAKELLGLAVSSSDTSLAKVLRKPYFVPEAKRAQDLMREMQQEHAHMALVVDEYGMLSGLVTSEDLLEELVGEIEDEHDFGRPKRIQRLQNGAFVVDALLSLNDLEQLLGTRLNDRAAHYETLAGMILYELGELPDEGTTLVIDNHRFTCVKVKNAAIQKVKIEPLSQV